MSKVTNKGQLTSCYNKHNTCYVVKNKSKVTPDYETIHKECNKQLQSKFAVEAHGKLRSEWYHHNCLNNKLKTQHFGNTWYEVDRSEASWHEAGSIDILKEQQRLYNRLKKEYESDKHNNVTIAEKEKAITRKKNIHLLNGLQCSPRYDRIYGGL